MHRDSTEAFVEYMVSTAITAGQLCSLVFLCFQNGGLGEEDKATKILQ